METIYCNLTRIILVLFVLLTFSCSSEKSKPTPAESGNEPQTEKTALSLEIEVMENEVRIGDQTWARRNLEARTFRNGDPVNEAKTNPEWQKLGEDEKPAYGYFHNDLDRIETYGLMYNWYAVNDKRCLCPEGWRVATLEDWQKLIDYLGGAGVAGHLLKHDSGWGGDGNGTNQSGFEGLPGGFKGYDGISYSAGYMARWWTSTEKEGYFAFGLDINFDQNNINISTGYKQDGFSVRCIKE